LGHCRRYAEGLSEGRPSLLIVAVARGISLPARQHETLLRRLGGRFGGA
jgi:hypothetical protein